MNKLSYKYKIAIASGIFILFAAAMFFYGYGILDERNKAMADAAMEREAQYELLKIEQKGFEQGQKDLAKLAEKPVPPEELFSKDTKVVKEIKMLEEIAAQNDIEFSLSISGSTKTAVKATGTSSDLLTIPYTATLTGTFEGVMKFLQRTEHLPFVTQTKTVNISSADKGTIKAILNSEFYIKK